MSDNSVILVGHNDRTVWIKVEGKGNFLTSGGMKDFCNRMLQRGFRSFIVDLERCSVMDSTFMGTLTGVALRLERDLGGGKMQVIHPNERNSDLLIGLGLDHVFEIRKNPASGSAEATTQPLSPEESGVQTKEETTRTMLEAHEALVQAEPENITKFRDVLEFLKSDLESQP